MNTRLAVVRIPVLLLLPLAACTSLPTDVEEIDPCSTSTPISMGQSLGGEIDEGDCVLYEQVLTDRWEVTVSEEISLEIEVTSPAFDAFIELRTASDLQIAWADDYGPRGSYIVHSVSPGRYTIVVGRIPGGASGGTYEIRVDQGPDCSPVGSLTVGSSGAGSIDEEDCWLDGWTTVDNWSLELEEDQKLRIDAESSAFDEMVLLRDARGQIYWGADVFGPHGARIETLVPAGDWTVSVGSLDGGHGDYSLSVSLAPPCTPGTELTAGQSVPGELSPDDCLFDGWSPADSFAVNLEDGVPVDILLKSADFRPWLLVRDQQGRDAGYGYDQDADGLVRLRLDGGPGPYAVFVLSDDWPPEGSYVLTVSSIECRIVGAIGPSDTASGTLDGTDCLRAGGGYQELWELDVPTDATVRIDLSSADFDAFLTVSSEDGTVLATDDDGGPGLDASLELGVAAGRYLISASSFGSGQTGDYRLKTTTVAPASTSGG